jgi:hypothetical protein
METLSVHSKLKFPLTTLPTGQLLFMGNKKYPVVMERTSNLGIAADAP